jgi:hypothetical protein
VASEEFRSQVQDFGVRQRDPEELRILNRWAWLYQSNHVEGPETAFFGLSLGALERRQMQNLLSQLQPGELADLLALTIRLQDLYHGTPEFRTTGNRELVEWLQAQPEIKREVLLRESLSCAQSHQRLSSTETALEAIADKGGDE